MHLGPTGGPALSAGPRLIRAARLALLLLLGPAAAQAIDWIPPRHVTAVLPSATLAPSSSATLDLCVVASGAPATLFWTAVCSGQFPCVVTPSSGSFGVSGGAAVTIPLGVSLPDTANGISVLTVVLDDAGGARAAKATALITAATGGRPEVRPVPGTWLAAAGSSGSVAFQIHSLIGSSEQIVITTGRTDPDANNGGALFAGTAVTSPVSLPGNGTITVSAPTTIPSNAYAGNLNTVQISVTSNEGISVATGAAVASTTGSVPTALYPAGLTPHEETVSGRDGAALLSSRGYWLVPSGPFGVRVHRVTSTDSIGIVDAAGDGVEDRWVGTLAVPPYAAAVDVVPGFVTASSETLDVGLIAAGRGGLVLFDLRSVEDPVNFSWSDLYDVDGNGIDDRILRTIPTSGFATDVAWFRTPSGRVIALVADADSGSVPVSADYNPALTVAGSGQGVVAIDVGAALDTVTNPPYLAGTLPTPGSALDLELRGGSSPDLVIADGASGVAVYGLAASGGVPATVTFTPRGTVPLSTAWGSPYGRDVVWISNTKDSLYAAVAAAAGGLQIVRVPRSGGGSPLLVLSQQTLAPAIGVAGTWTGTLAAAMGTSGVALLRAPAGASLSQIGAGAPPPYTAPVVLARGAAWSATGAALEVAAHRSWISSATALRFEPTSGAAPDLVVSDGARLILLRPGNAAITAVEAQRTVPIRSWIALGASPNPSTRGTVLEVRSEDGGPFGNVLVRIFDAKGRLVRELVHDGAGAPGVRIAWDGCDRAGRQVASGRYWARAVVLGPYGVRSALPLVILR